MLSGFDAKQHGLIGQIIDLRNIFERRIGQNTLLPDELENADHLPLFLTPVDLQGHEISRLQIWEI